ncbi:hypothetical protein GCM10027614_02690 [Micromonospora vulcania]
MVCGDSQFAHMLADRLFTEGERVVVVRAEPFGPLEYRRRRYLGVIGDPTSSEVLRGAGLPQAHTVYACSDDDDRNHAIANAASRLIQDRRQPARVYVQVHDPELCLALQARRLGAAGSSRLRLDYFHVDDVAARALHRYHPCPGPRADRSAFSSLVGAPSVAPRSWPPRGTGSYVRRKRRPGSRCHPCTSLWSRRTPALSWRSRPPAIPSCVRPARCGRTTWTLRAWPTRGAA